GSLARAEQVTAPTATRLVLGMERDGLVRREGDEQDGRVVWLHPTAKGTRLLHEGRQRRVAALARDLAPLSAADRETLTAAVEILERLFGHRASGAESTRHSGADPRARPERSSFDGAQDERRSVRPGPASRLVRPEPVEGRARSGRAHGSTPTRR